MQGLLFLRHISKKELVHKIRTQRKARWVLCMARTEGAKTMTMELLLTITMIAIAAFLSKAIPEKTLIDILIAVIVVAMFRILKGKNERS